MLTRSFRLSHLVLILALAFAPAALSAVTPPDWVAPGSDLPVDPAVRWGRLANGVRYAIRHNDKPRSRASLRLVVQAGSFNETEAQRGLAHFLEHLAFNGTEHFPAGKLVMFLQRLGMSFGGDTNASTTFEHTIYMLELPNTQPNTLDTAFTLLADYGGGMLLEPTAIEKERGIILSEARARDSAEYRNWIANTQFLFPGTRLAERMPIGLPEVIQHAQRPLFQDFYDTWYRPEKLIVVAAGDFDVDQVEALIRQRFGSLVARASARPDPAFGPIVDDGGVHVAFRADRESPRVSIQITATVPHRPPPDTRAEVIADMTRSLAFDMFSERLRRALMDPACPYQGAIGSVTDGFRAYRTASLNISATPDRWAPAVTAAMQELRRTLTFGFDPAELRPQIASMRSALESAVKSKDGATSPSYASALLTAIDKQEAMVTPEDDAAIRLPALERITVDDCLQAFRAVWQATSTRHLYVSGDLTLADPKKEIQAVYQASLQAPIAPPAKITEATWTYTRFGTPGTVAHREDIADLGITLVEFANHVRLNLKPHRFNPGSVFVTTRIGDGKLCEPPGQPGISIIAERLQSGGLGRMTTDEFNRLMSGKEASSVFTIREDALAFQLPGTTQDDLPLGLQVMCAWITDPGYRPEMMVRWQDSQLSSYKSNAHSLEEQIQRQIEPLLSQNHPRFGMPRLEDVLVRTPEEMRAWLDPQFRSGAIEVTITGDFDIDKTIAAVAATLGALPPRDAKKPLTEQRRVAKLPVPVSRRIFADTEIPRGLALVYWPATDGRDIKLKRRLTVLSSVFSDRLRVKIREQMGDTYSPGAGAQLSDEYPDYGWIMGVSTIAPDKAAEVIAAIKAVAADLVAHGVTEDELVRARQPILTAMRTSEQENQYWESLLTGLSVHPGRIENARTRLADVQSITTAELSELAAKYLRPERASDFTLLPASAAK